MSTKATEKTRKGPLFVWIAGTLKADFFSTEVKLTPLRAWELNGIYSKKEAAIARCKTAHDFIAQVRFNVDLGAETRELESTEYPLAKAGGWQ